MPTKRLIAVLFFLVFCLSLSSCGDDGGKSNSEQTGDSEIRLTVNEKIFIAKLCDNETAQVFKDMLPMILSMSAMTHEKYCNLSDNLPTDTFNPGAINAGDIMLWQSNCLVLFYESFSTTYSYTKIGRIENTAGLATALGTGNVTVAFSISSDNSCIENDEDLLKDKNENNSGYDKIEDEINNGGQTEEQDSKNPSTEENDIDTGVEIKEMKITINGMEFIATLYDNETAKALAAMLPMTVNMSAMAHEKYYYLQSNLPVSSISPGTIQEGDIMLWGSNCLVLFYESFSTPQNYTKIGRVKNTGGLAAAVGADSVTVIFSKA